MFCCFAGQGSLKPNGSAAMSDGGTQSSSNGMSAEISEAGMEISVASKEASKQVIKGMYILHHMIHMPTSSNYK